MASEEPESHPGGERYPRVAMVKHHFQFAAGGEYAYGFGKRAVWTRRVMQDSSRVDDIKRRVVEREGLGVGDANVGGEPGLRQPFVREGDGPVP